MESLVLFTVVVFIGIFLFVFHRLEIHRCTNELKFSYQRRMLDYIHLKIQKSRELERRTITSFMEHRKEESELRQDQWDKEVMEVLALQKAYEEVFDIKEKVEESPQRENLVKTGEETGAISGKNYKT